MTTTWRTAALGEEITFQPGVDPAFTQDNDGFWVSDPEGGDVSFVEIPLVDGALYDVVAPPEVWGFVGVFEIVANDGPEPQELPGYLYMPTVIPELGAPVDLTSPTSDYAGAVEGWGSLGITLEPRSLGLIFSISALGDQSITVRLAGDPLPDPPAATPMRHRTRHLHRTIVDHLTAELTAGGWFANPPTNFAGVNTVPVTVIDYEPQMLGEVPPYNTVAISLGDEGDDEGFELGDFGVVVRLPVFVDIYPLNEPIGIAIADDTKAALVNRVIPLLDYTTDADGVETTGSIEFEHVQIEKLQSTLMDKRSWRAVKATVAFYPPAG